MNCRNLLCDVFFFDVSGGKIVQEKVSEKHRKIIEGKAREIKIKYLQLYSNSTALTHHGGCKEASND
jgi:hypothetical protein